MNDSSMSDSHQFTIEKAICSARECPQQEKHLYTDSALSNHSSSCSATHEGTDQEDVGYLQFDLLHNDDT